jgi:hypothetical protein
MFPSNYPETDDAVEAARLREKVAEQAARIAALQTALAEAREAMEFIQIALESPVLLGGAKARARRWLERNP